MENIGNDKITNKIIKSMLKSFKDYNNNLNARIRADSIFLFLDGNANKAFSKLINLSNSRYKAIKSGINIKSMISKQKKNYSLLNDKFQNDILFNSPTLITEKKKLDKSVNVLKNKEIVDLREKLINSLRADNDYDIIMKEKYKKILEKRKSKENESQIKAQEKLYGGRNKSQKRSIKIKKIYGQSLMKLNKKKEEKKEHIKKDDNDEKEEEKQKLAEKVMKEDLFNFTNGINFYKKILNKAKTLSENEDNERIRIDKRNFEDISKMLKYNNIKALSFHDYDFYTDIKKEEKDITPDIHKLIKLKLYHDNNIKANKTINLSKNNYDKHLPNSQEDSLNQKINKKNNSMFLNTYNFSNIRRKPISNFSFRDTVNIVKGQSQEGISLIDNFNDRKLRFDKMFNQLYTENDLNVYERELKIRNRMFQKSRENKSEKEEIFINNETIHNDKNKKRGVNKILDDFQDIYKIKKKKWEKEDIIREKRKLLLENQMQEIEYFLNESARKKRQKTIQDIRHKKIKK